MADPLRTVFRKPFKEQLAALRLRLGNLTPTTRWDDITKSQHDRAFMVAGAMKADLLADLGLAVDRAIAEGTGLDAFRKDFRAIVAKHGWHGWTGEGSKRGEAWRTRVIYKTNLRTTYMAGRHAQLIKGNYKFWVYRHGGSLEPRLHHLSWDGVALPPDHPFWRTHFAPNGWGCSCRVFGARTRKGILRVGGDPDKTLPDDWQSIDPKTGTLSGIDKGWDYAPGATVADEINQLKPKLEKLPPQPSIDLIQSWLATEVFAAWFAKPIGTWPLLRITEDHASRIGSKQHIAMLSPETVAKQLRRHPELSVEDYLDAQRVVSEATSIIEDGTNVLIFVLEPKGEKGKVLVVKATRSGDGLFVTSFRHLSRREARRDQELRRLLRKN